MTSQIDAATGVPPSGPGPLWTRARLERVMCLRFGFGANGAADTRAAAEAMGVSQRTVQRWLHATHGRSVAHIPARRLNQLISLLRPDGEVLAREAQQARYAAKAIEGLHLPRKMGIKPAWERQGWLEQHVVVVLDIKVEHLRIRQVATSRVTVAKLDDLKRRGRIVDHVIVPTRFHATLLVHRTLDVVEAWRFQAGDDQVLQGFTQAWLADAPETNLSAWAIGLFPEVSQRHFQPHLPE